MSNTSRLIPTLPLWRSSERRCVEHPALQDERLVLLVSVASTSSQLPRARRSTMFRSLLKQQRCEMRSSRFMMSFNCRLQGDVMDDELIHTLAHSPEEIARLVSEVPP